MMGGVTRHMLSHLKKNNVASATSEGHNEFRVNLGFFSKNIVVLENKHRYGLYFLFRISPPNVRLRN